MSESTAITTLKGGGALRSIVPQTFEDVQRFALMAVKSGLFKGASGDAQAQATMAILQGMEVGLLPMQAIQTIAVINGRCTIWGDAIPGLLFANGFKIEEMVSGTDDAMTATCTITRPDGQRIARSFSVAEAKIAGLWGKAGPWKNFPRRMLQMRARGFCFRDGAADVSRGLYTREEAEDTKLIDVTPAKAAAVAAPAGPPDIPDDIPEMPADDEPITDVAGYLAQIEGVLAGCETEQEVQEAWEQDEQTVETRIERSQRQQFFDCVERHIKRVAAAKAQAAE